jgi:two-component system, NtrC family, nitrogen regulation response regulator GlnG
VAEERVTKATDVLREPAAKPLELKLVVVSGPDFGTELPLDAGTYRVGKGSGNELRLKDSSVSRTHLVLEVIDGGRIRLTDNQSTNGSFVNGTRFTSVEVGAGATVHIGQSDLRIMPKSARAPALPPSTSDHFGGLVGTSLAMRQSFAVLERVAAEDSDVLVQGETGTGKDLCAEALHAASRRAKGPFVICDLAGTAPSLFESELFGHVKGAFTGAQADRAGAFERAHGGTLFLDEVGELPAEVQPRLLRALERRQVKRVGANDYRTVDVRVIAATHKDLEEEVQQKRFRQDLYFRLAVVKVTLPPLRERPEDIGGLVDYILRGLQKPPSQLSDATRALLRDYSWPGNVRELRNIVERTVSLGGEAELPEETATKTMATGPAAELPFKEAKERLLAAFERDYLADLLKRCEGNVAQAARESGIHRVHLHRLLKKHGIDSRGDGP